jgi:predicted nucleic-acid-binding protein
VVSVDTNVLLRYLLQDDRDQSPKANRLFGSTKKMLINDMVLVEALWTLKGEKYNLGKQEQLMVLSPLFKEPNVIFENRQTVWPAMNCFRTSEKIKVGNKKKEADFADALILEKSKSICHQMGEFFMVRKSRNSQNSMTNIYHHLICLIDDNTGSLHQQP